MKILLEGKNSQKLNKLVTDLGFEIVDSAPEVIVTFGGDGTLLSAERLHPGIPKLPLRDSDFCHKCLDHTDEIILKKLISSKLKLTEYPKLAITLLYKNFYALNDFVIRNSDPTHTIRFRTSNAKGALGPLLIGDGIVISTPFGASGYFKSITRHTFDKGFGVAFNNTTAVVPPLYLSTDEKLIFQLIRGKATLSYDNSPDIFTIDESSELIFTLSNRTAKIYQDTSLRCSNCQVIRDHN